MRLRCQQGVQLPGDLASYVILNGKHITERPLVCSRPEVLVRSAIDELSHDPDTPGGLGGVGWPARRRALRLHR